VGKTVNKLTKHADPIVAEKAGDIIKQFMEVMDNAIKTGDISTLNLQTKDESKPTSEKGTAVPPELQKEEGEKKEEKEAPKEEKREPKTEEQTVRVEQVAPPPPVPTGNTDQDKPNQNEEKQVVEK